MKRISYQLMALAMILSTGSTALAADDESGTFDWDGLVPVEESRVHAAYINPEADFAVFQRVAILDPFVAFRSNWQRDQNRSRSRNIRASDLDRIKTDVAALFKDVFTEELETAGYEVVNYSDEDVLILRPAILDLDVVAPDVRSSARNRTYTATTGSATLMLELFDALSGDLVGRAADRRTARNGGGFATVSNRVTNRAEARREFRVWANKLVEFLDSHYVKVED